MRFDDGFQKTRGLPLWKLFFMPIALNIAKRAIVFVLISLFFNLSSHGQCGTTMDTSLFPEDYTIECSDSPPAWNIDDFNVVTSTCGSVNIIGFLVNFLEGECEGNYTIVYSLTYVDGCSTCSKQLLVHVVDNTNPVFESPLVDVNLLPSDPIPSGDVIVSDNCSDVSYFYSDQWLPADGCVQHLLRSYVATDGCGNTSYAYQNFFIVEPDAVEVQFVLSGIDFHDVTDCGFAIYNNAFGVGELVYEYYSDGGTSISESVCLTPGCYVLLTGPRNNNWENWDHISGWMLLGADETIEGVYSGSQPFSIGGPCDIAGCTDPEACNYNPFAFIPGLCFEYCLDFDFGDIPPIAENWVLGISQPNSNIYQEFALPFSGTFSLEPFTSYQLNLYGPPASNWGGGEVFFSNQDWDWSFSSFISTYSSEMISFTTGGKGCTNQSACNYNPLATVDDGSCSFAIGCMDPQALNYDPTAGCDSGQCEYCTPTMSLQILAFNQMGNEEITVYIYNPDGTLFGAYPKGFDYFTQYGLCLPPSCGEYKAVMISNSPYPSASFTITNNQGAFYQGYGTAQVPFYANEVIEGCLDSLALNFNPQANCPSDVPCTYPDLCKSDLNGDGFVGLSDLLEFISSFGSFCP